MIATAALLAATLSSDAVASPIDAAAFVSPTYEGSASQLRHALRRPGQTRRIRRMSFSAQGVDRNCHTQAISVADDVVMTSCVDRRNQTGWLQIFGRKTDEPRSFSDVAGLRLVGDRFPHPSVGHAVVKRGQEGRILVPIGREPFDVHGADDHSRLEVRDQDGALVCAIDNDRRGGLAATALVVSDDHLFAVAVGYTHLLIWRIDAVDTDGSCVAERMFDAPGLEAAGRRWRRYQGIATIVDRDGDVYLFGGRQHRLDVWALRGFGRPDMVVEEVASMEWRPAAMPVRGVFHEGLSVEPRADRLRIWAAPRDFWRGTCLPARAEKRCTPAVYVVEQPLDAPRMSWR